MSATKLTKWLNNKAAIGRMGKIRPEIGWKWPKIRIAGQGDRHLTVMHRSRGENRGNGDATIGSIDVEFVAFPARLMPFAIAFGADITSRG